jgi:flagellar assembly factor FliW
MTAAATSTLETAETVDVPVLDFVSAIPGFPAHRRFVLVRVTEEGVLFALTAVDDPELRFLCGAPGAVLPGLRAGDRRRIDGRSGIRSTQDVQNLLTLVV